MRGQHPVLSRTRSGTNDRWHNVFIQDTTDPHPRNGCPLHHTNQNQVFRTRSGQSQDAATSLMSKVKLRPTSSLPVFSYQKPSTSQQLATRPLPALPVKPVKGARKTSEGPSRQFQSHKANFWSDRKEPIRRRTVHDMFTNGWKAPCEDTFVENLEDHIYEEIDDLEQAPHPEIEFEKSFLSLISSQRRQNLRFYGCTDWDFGTEVI